jgi:regulatory protein PHO2
MAADSTTYSGSSKGVRGSSRLNEQRSPSPLSSSASAVPVDPTNEDADKRPPQKKKRKRTRVTPEQLAELESLFATERSPTASRRRQISEKLGMQERQTQVWFQNR